MGNHDQETFADCRASASPFASRLITPEIRGNSFGLESDTPRSEGMLSHAMAHPQRQRMPKPTVERTSP